MILINMITGRSPWLSAVCSDESFRAYLQDPNYLHTMLPLSKSASSLLRRILALNPLARLSIAEIRAEILGLDTFYMTESELKRSTDDVRYIAESYLQIKLAAHVRSQPDYDSDYDDLAEMQLYSPNSNLIAPEALPRGRPLPKLPVTASSFTSPPSMLTAGGYTLALPSPASSYSPITPEAHAVADSNIADVLDALEDLVLPSTDGLVGNLHDLQPAAKSKAVSATKKERNPNILRQVVQKLRLRH
jgi:serine/threonine protein kinase